jgi:glutamine amidotransferase-like uncharacterized protein
MEWRIRGFYCRKLLGLCALSILCLILLSPVQSTAQVEHDDLTGVKVAIYNGAGVLESSRTALTRMFEWMNASVVIVNASQVLEGFLNDFDIFVVPGGSESTACRELQYDEGVSKIQDFVDAGGSYFGICGGATYGSNYLHLFNGSMGPVSEPGSLIHITIMHIYQSPNGPDLSDIPENFSTMYWGSQYFLPRYGSDARVIATYEYNNAAGMVACKYGSGTVFLSSPHPEYEENDDRDGTTFGDDLVDPDSEWPLLLSVSKWLVEASSEEPTATTTPSTTTIPTDAATTLDMPLIAIASTGIVMVVLVVSVVYRRTRY